MKSTGYEKHYTEIIPPKDGMAFHKASPTKKLQSKLSFNCDHCGILFEKYACWAKRTTHHYCGRACASAAKVIRIPKNCVVCDTEMLLTPTYFKRVSACSKTCQRKRRTGNNSNLRSSPDYNAIIKRVRKNAVCKECNATSGPWIVRGVRLWVEDGLACADGETAYLVCQKCHLKSVTHLSLKSTYMSDRGKYYEEIRARGQG